MARSNAARDCSRFVRVPADGAPDGIDETLLGLTNRAFSLPAAVITAGIPQPCQISDHRSRPWLGRRQWEGSENFPHLQPLEVR